MRALSITAVSFLATTAAVAGPGDAPGPGAGSGSGSGSDAAAQPPSDLGSVKPEDMPTALRVRRLEQRT
jgi:hypothetical protein